MSAATLGRLGPYELVEELGRGGMGVVYRARRADLDREFAVKVLAPGAEPEARERFRREAMAAARLAGHPGIVAVHDTGEAPLLLAGGGAGPPVAYLAMDLVPGRTLEALVADGELVPAEVAPLFAQLARALAEAHAQGVLHRDVKPANVLVDPSRRPRLADFGLARVHALDAAAGRLTRSDTVLGTPAYMAPEQVRGEPLDARTDVWGLGAALYEALAGRPPFEGATLADLLRRVLHDPPPPLAPVPGAAPGLAAIARRCLAKDPGARYPDATALADDLERAARGERPRAAAPRWWRARGLAGMGVAAVLIGGGAWWWASHAPAGTAGDPLAAARRATAASTALLDAEAAFDRLRAGSGAALCTLEDACWDAPVDAAEVDRARAQLAAVVAAVRADHPAARSPAAWEALATLFGGEPRAGRDALDAARAAAGDDPFPATLSAMAWWQAWAVRVGPPEVTLGTREARIGPLIEDDGARRQRGAAALDLDAAAASPLWPRLRAADAYRQFVLGAQLLATGRPDAAVPHLLTASSEPELAGTIGMLLGMAAQLAGDHEAAIRALDVPAARGWPRALHLAATARMGAALRPEAAPAEARAHLDAALVACERALAAGPRTDFLDLRGVVLAARARVEERLGAAATEWHRRAFDALGAALARDPAFRSARRNRVMQAGALADALGAEGRDAAEVLATGLADADTLLAAEPDDRAIRRERAQLVRLAAEGGLQRGDLAVAPLRGALADLDRCLALVGRDDPEVAELRAARGEVGRLLAFALGKARAPGGLGALESAVADFDDALRVRPAHAEARIGRAIVRTLLGRAAAERGQDPVPLWIAALADLDAAADDPRAGRPVAANRATTTMLIVRERRSRGEDPRPALQAGERALDAALGRWPDDSRLRLARAMMRSELGAALATAADPEAGEAYARSLADVEALLPVHPRMWSLHDLHGQVLAVLGRRDEARAAFEAALRLEPNAPGVAERLAALRPR